MRETDYITLELYLDGELAPADITTLEQRLSADPQLMQALTNLKQARALRSAALHSYMPDEMETRQLANKTMAFCRENQYASLARILQTYSVNQWFKRAGFAAACLLIAVSSYWIGRSSVLPAAQTMATSAQSPIIGYTVQISTPGGQVVSHFPTYQQAAQFAQTYTTDEQAVSNNQQSSTQQVAAASNTGVF